MNRDVLKGKWGQLKGNVKSWWGDMTDDDVTKIEGDSEKFVGVLQEKYGYGREKAEKEIDEFLKNPTGRRRVS